MSPELYILWRFFFCFHVRRIDHNDYNFGWKHTCSDLEKFTERSRLNLPVLHWHWKGNFMIFTDFWLRKCAGYDNVLKFMLIDTAEFHSKYISNRFAWNMGRFSRFRPCILNYVNITEMKIGIYTRSVFFLAWITFFFQKEVVIVQKDNPNQRGLKGSSLSLSKFILPAVCPKIVQNNNLESKLLRKSKFWERTQPKFIQNQFCYLLTIINCRHQFQLARYKNSIFFPSTIEHATALNIN